MGRGLSEREGEVGKEKGIRETGEKVSIREDAYSSWLVALRKLSLIFLR